MRRWLFLSLMLAGCTTKGGVEHLGYFQVFVTAVDGGPVPTAGAERQPSPPGTVEVWSFTVDAIDPEGNLNEGFNGYGRVLAVPGSVRAVVGTDGAGRNVRITAGHGEGDAEVLSAFGPSRLWVQDIGYAPAGPGEIPLCSNGTDDDNDVVVDFPTDPGCAFADDMTEESGTLLTGVSQELSYLRPSLADVQGRSAETAYTAVSAQLRTSPNQVIVTRVAAAGFFVTDLSETDPYDPLQYNHLFAFNFNTPTDMRVCDRVSELSGTVAEFFGFTELSFPSYEIGLWDLGRPANECTFKNEIEVCGVDSYCRRGTCQPCLVPPPFELDNMTLQSDALLESLESGLVTMQQFRIPRKFGPDIAVVDTSTSPPSFLFQREKFVKGQSVMVPASNCDLNQDGALDFNDALEGGCANACSADADCTDWLGFASRGNYKVARGSGPACSFAVQGGPSSQCMQVNTSTVTGFSPLAHLGQTLSWVTGTLRNFSGGALNWTVETRCGDDLVCSYDNACAQDPATGMPRTMPTPSSQACKTPPTRDDNDAATN